MKERGLAFTGVAFVAVLLSAGAWAQADLGTRLQTEVPVSFKAGNTVLPAGKYEFLVDLEANRVEIVAESTNQSAILFGSPGEASADGHFNVTIQKVGGTYQLAGLSGGDFGIDFLPSKAVSASPYSGIIEGITDSAKTSGTRTK